MADDNARKSQTTLNGVGTGKDLIKRQMEVIQRLRESGQSAMKAQDEVEKIVGPARSDAERAWDLLIKAEPSLASLKDSKLVESSIVELDLSKAAKRTSEKAKELETAVEYLREALVNVAGKRNIFLFATIGMILIVIFYLTYTPSVPTTKGKEIISVIPNNRQDEPANIALPAQTQVPIPIETTTPVSESVPVKVLRSVIARNLDANKNPLGVSSIFVSNEIISELIYYAVYEGAVPNRTAFQTEWYNKDNLIVRSNSFIVSVSSGYFSHGSGNIDFMPGEYEVRLFADGNEVDRISFVVNNNYIDPSSKYQENAKINKPVVILKTRIARDIDTNSNLYGVSSVFRQYETNKGLVCYAEFDGAVPGKVNVISHWYRNNVLYYKSNEINLNINKGHIWYRTKVTNFPPGNYEVRLISDNIEIEKIHFSVVN